MDETFRAATAAADPWIENRARNEKVNFSKLIHPIRMNLPAVERWIINIILSRIVLTLSSGLNFLFSKYALNFKTKILAPAPGYRFCFFFHFINILRPKIIF